MDINTLLLLLILIATIIIGWKIWLIDKYVVKERFFEETAISEDELFNKAIELLNGADTISTSYIQSKLRVGYARAGRLLDLLEQGGYVESATGATPRKVLKKTVR